VSQASAKGEIRASRGSRRALVVLAVMVSLMVAACGSDSDGGGSTGAGSTGGSGETGSKLIIYEVGFPCGLNDYTTQLCNGIKDTAKTLPAAYRVEIKTGVDYKDAAALNNQIQTSLELKPAGLLVFATGPAAHTPMLKRACEQGVKIITIDVGVDGLGDCLSSHIGADNTAMGESVARWLLERPALGKEVGVVNFPPGQIPASDQRVKGFTDAVKAAGYDVVAEVSTQLSLDDTRTQVTNMLTANPNLSVIFAANSIIGSGVRQALKGDRDVTLLAVDGVLDDVPHILDGTIGAEAAQAPYLEGKLAVEYMVTVLEGKRVPRLTYTPSKVIDKTNAEEYRAAGGLR